MHDGVLVPIYGGIDAHAEAVLMVLRQRAGRHDIPPIRGFALVDIHHAHDPRRARLDYHPARLVELVREHVLVVRERDDELHDQFPSARHDRAARAPVRVLPVDPVVLLVDADDVGRFLAFPVRAHDHAVQVLDHAQAVAAELEVVGAVAEAAVAEVEGLLAVEWGARVRVGDRLTHISLMGRDWWMK